MHLVHRDCLEEVAFNPELLNGPAGREGWEASAQEYRHRRRDAFEGRVVVPRGDGIEGAERSLLSRLAVEAAGSVTGTEALFVMVEARLTVMVLQPYIPGDRGI